MSRPSHSSIPATASGSPDPARPGRPSQPPPPRTRPRPPSGPTHARPGRAVATRVVVPALKIDLPVVKGNSGYPYCNVAMYLHTAGSASKDAFGQPGEGRATYLYAHARDGMFGPIYELAIQKRNAKKMLGMLVQVYTSDFKLHLYEIREYRLHATDLDDPWRPTARSCGSRPRRARRARPARPSCARARLASPRRTRGRRAEGQARAAAADAAAGSARGAQIQSIRRRTTAASGRHRDHEPGHEPEPARLAACERRPASLMPKMPGHGPDARPGSRSRPVSRFMIVERLLLTVER